MSTAAGRVVGAPLVHRTRHEVVQRHDSDYGRRERGRDGGIAHIGEMAFTVCRNRMNLGVEGVEYRSGSPRKIDQHCARINVIHSEPVRSKPCGNRVDVPRAGAETPSKLIRGQPMVIIWRVWIFELAEQLLQCALALWQAPEQ
jgi:hypothetical protein